MNIEVTLPTLHADQVAALKLPGRFKAIRCGRRWGKTLTLKTIAADAAIKGQYVGIFAPDYKRLSETFAEIEAILRPVKKSSSKVDGVIRTITGGTIDFWTLEDESAGRSRKYHKALIDEAAFAKPNMMAIWERAIKPTLLDYQGRALVFSNTNGIDAENFFWQICNEPKHGFVSYHAPTQSNPLIPLRLVGEPEADWQARRDAEFAAILAANHPLVYAQEYLADFVDFSGVAFFAMSNMLENDQPVDYPPHCDGVFAVIDSAVKTGKEHDGTAVIYFALSRYTGHPLIILDYDIVQIEGALLETWLPTVFENLDHLAKATRATAGSLGAWIEDKSSGMILLQQAQRHGWQAQAIDSKLTSVGKDERAISVSGYVYRGMVKLSRVAYNRIIQYKDTTRNQLRAQVTGFRIGDKTPNRADDLLDCFCYGIAIALGNSEGF